MSRFSFKMLLQLCVLLALSTATFAQSADDSFYEKFLSDTLHAAAKINELVDSAKFSAGHDEESPSRIIRRYEVALALAPYAQDSLAVISKLYANYSTWLYTAGATDLAISYARTALALGKKGYPPGNSTPFHLTSRLINYYGFRNQFDSARIFATLAVEEARKQTRYVYVASAINNMGFLYDEMNLPDSAMIFYRRALASLPLRNIEDSGLVVSIYDNIGQNFLKQGKTDSALMIFRLNESLSNRIHFKGKSLQAQFGIFYCLLAKKNFNGAGDELSALEKYAEKEQLLSRVEWQLKFLQAKREYFTATAGWKQVTELEKRLSHLQDSISTSAKEATDELLRSSTSYEVVKAKKEIQSKEAELKFARHRATQNLFIAAIVALLSIAVVLLLLLFFRNRSALLRYENELAKKELHNKQLEQEKLEEELKHRRGDLTELGAYLSKIKDLHETIAERVSGAKVNDITNQKEVLKSIEKEIAGNADISQRADLIQQNIDKVNSAFYDELLKKFPSLTRSELELCGLMKLRLSNKEIAALKNISPDTIKRARNRLKNKLGVPAEEDLQSFMLKI